LLPAGECESSRGKPEGREARDQNVGLDRLGIVYRSTIGEGGTSRLSRHGHGRGADKNPKSG